MQPRLLLGRHHGFEQLGKGPNAVDSSIDGWIELVANKIKRTVADDSQV
ncbi:MAG TPA: hypothetical protein VMP01_11830 [Pirellulaceae bacterium]|nr:hypothetical protein [Pirellulaceae bacterium]